MTKQDIRERIEAIAVVPAIRLSCAEDALFAADAVVESGIPILEVTMTVPGAVNVISELTHTHRNLIVGAGTLHDVTCARQCLDAGAVFLTTPALDLEIVEFARLNDVVVFPGALTPSEVLKAWKAGSDFVKVFPCAPVGGPSYIRALRNPFPDIPLIASGGVNQQTAADFIQAGAVALGIGRDLSQPGAITRRERGWIRELSRRFLGIVKEARGRNGTIY